MNKLRKFLYVSVMVMTIFAMSGVVIAPSAKASASAGDLIKMAGNSSVYYLNSDGKRYVFPNESTYFSWYTDFSGVVTIPATELQSYLLGGNVTVRPGTKLVKITTDPSVYAVAPNGTLRKIASEADAIAMFGSLWAKRVIDVADSFFTNYTIGAPLTSGSYAAGTLLKNAGSNNIYYYDGTNYRLIANEAAFTANRFNFANVITTTTTLTAGGTTITTGEFANTAQNGGTGPIITGSGLLVALAVGTPGSATIPSNSSGVVFTKFNVTAASDGPVTIDTIKVKRTGVGAYNDLSAVYLYDGDARLTTGKTFASDTNEAEFSALNLTIAAGTTKTLSIVANIGASKSGQHALGIASASAIISSGAAVSGSFPIVGSTMSLSSSTSAGTVTVAASNTGMSNPTIGDTGTAVASFKLTTDEDGWFKNITLKQDGTLTTSLLSNYKLYQGTTELPITTTVNNRKVTLSLNTPFKLLNGSSKIFTVKADISSSSETGKTVVFFMDTAADILTTGDAYGYGMVSSFTGYDAFGDSTTLTLQGGSVTIANTSAAAHDVKIDTTGVELARVNITSSADTVEIQKMTAVIDTVKATNGGLDYGTYKDTNSDGDYTAGETLLLRNIKVKDAVTGQTLGSAKAITDAAAITVGGVVYTAWAASNDVDAGLAFSWSDYFTIAKGATRTVIIVADVNSAQVSNVKYTAKFDFATANFTAKDSQDKTVTDIVPASVISGNAVTTKSSSLSIALASTPETRTVVKGSTVDALGMIWSAGSGTGNDVKVSALDLDVYIDGDVNGTFALNTDDSVNAQDLVQQVELYVDGVKIAGPVAVSSTGHAIFTSSKFVGGSYTVMAGTNKTVIVKAVASTNAPYGTGDDAFSFNMVAADITAEDANGTVTASISTTDLNDNTPTTPAVSIRVTGNGTITTAVDSGRPDSQVIIAGKATEQELSRVKLTATKENFDVDKMTFQVNQAGSYDDVNYLKLYDAAGAALSGNVSLDAAGKATFTGLTIPVTKGVDKVVVVKGMLNAIGERTTATIGTAGVGADSGDLLTIELSTTDADFHATGAASSVVDTAANAANGQVMTVRKTIPTVAIATLPTTTLTTGTGAVLYKFTVTADANGDVVVKGVKPTMTLNDSDSGNELTVTPGSVYMYDVTNGASTQLNTGGVNEDAMIEIDDGKAVAVAATQTRTFEIRGDITGVESGDSISSKITKDGAALSAGTETADGGGADDAIADAANAFIWSDKSADTNAVTSTEWGNSYLLPSWPTSTATLSK